MSAKVLRMGHVALCVSDIDRSLAFYRDLLDFTVTLDEVQDTTRGGLPHVYKRRHGRRRVVHLRYGEGEGAPFLVLTSHPDDQPDGEAIQLDQIGINHVAFAVADVEALAKDLLAKGAQTCGPVDAFKDASGKISSVFFLDPDGILVQFDRGRRG